MILSPFFTIAIPTYNRAGMLKQTLESLRDQSFQNFEILIGDNASTDETEEVVKSFSDLPIRYQKRLQNNGPVANFNQLIADAHGEVFVLHWDDDFLHKDFLTRAYEALSQGEDRVAYATPHWHGPLGSGYVADLQAPDQASLQEQSYFLRDDLIEWEGPRAAVKTLVSFPMVFPTTAVRLTALRKAGGYFKEFEFGGDVVTMARVLSMGSVVYDARVGGYTRIHGKNSSLNQDKNWKRLCHRNKIQAIIDFFEGDKILWRDLLQRELSQMTEGRILMELKVLTGNECNRSLVNEVYKGLKEKSGRNGIKFLRKLISRIGFKNSFYLWKCIRR
jgi:glycosyltransferase involved in cell wall biosynthesis